MKILVVRFREIGDSVLASPLCNSLKKSFPDSQVDYVVYEHIAPLFADHPYIDNVISISKSEQKNLFKYIKKVWNITRAKYDIIIDIMSTPKSELFTLFSMKSKYRIGRFKKHRGYTYTDKIKDPEDYKDKVDKFLFMLKPLEREYKIIYDENYIVRLTSEEKDLFHKKMLNAGIDFSKPVFIAAINSRVPRKVYNIDNMLKVVKRVIDELNGQVIFFYSPAEKEFAMSAYNKLNKDKNIFTNIETKSIRELAMLIANCTMFFGNEGGPRHIAQALGIPTVSVFNPHSVKKEWLSGANDMQQGIEPHDMPGYLPTLTDEEKYALITPEAIFDLILKVFKKIK